MNLGGGASYSFADNKFEVRKLTPSDFASSSALDRLGLHLDARKAPLDVVVVDSIRRTPTDN